MISSSNTNGPAAIYSAFDLLSEGIWEIQEDGQTLFANKWLCQLLGYSSTEVLSLNFLDEIQRCQVKKYTIAELVHLFQSHEIRNRFEFLDRNQEKKFLTISLNLVSGRKSTDSLILVCSKNFLHQELQQHFENLQSLANVGVWELDPSTGQTFWSSQVYQIYGVDRSIPTNRIQGIDFYVPEDRVKVSDAVEGALKGKPFLQTFRLVDASGVYKWVEVRGEPVIGSSGELLLVKGTIADVTQTVSREKDLCLVLDNINEGYWDWNILEDYEFMSARFWEILGYDPATKKSHPSEWQKLIHPSDFTKVKDAFAGISQDPSKQSFVADVRYRHGLGHWLWTRCSGKVVERDLQGQPIRVVGTHQNITEEMLLERENRSLIDALNSTMVVSKTDLEGNITYVNELFCAVSKYRSEELIGHSHRIVKSGKQSAEFYESMWKTISSKCKFHGEVCNRAKDGELFWMDLTIAPSIGPEGEIVEFIAFGHLINDQKSAELKLKESYAEIRQAKQRLELAVEAASLGTWSWDLTTNQVFYDERWADLRGAEYSELKQNFEDWSSRVHPDDLVVANIEIQQYLNGSKTTYSNTHRVKHADGSWRYILGRGRFAEWNSLGQPIRFVGTDMDVTEQVMRERTNQMVLDLRSNYINLFGDQKKFFNFVLSRLIQHFESEYGFIGEIRSDANGNPYLKTYAITDISWDENSRKFFEEQAPQGMEFRNLDTLFGHVIKTGKLFVANSPQEHPMRGGLPKGHPPLTAFLGVPIYYNNQFIAMVGLANKKSGYDECSLAYYQPVFDALGEMVNSVNLNSEIEAQKQFANHKSRLASIGEMASGVGHEINNPLAIISGQLSLLKNQVLVNKSDVQSVVTRIEKSQKAVERIANIVKGLRAFSRSDHSTRNLFNFAELVQETVEMLVEVFRFDGLQIASEIEKDQWTVGNRGRWQQVLVNLLNNARDACLGMPDPKIMVSLKSSDGKIQLKITDNGVGIPAELKDRIFDPFFTTKEVNHGTGIGLALTSTIIQEHGAKINVDSKVGHGSTFTIDLVQEQMPSRKKNISELNTSPSVDLNSPKSFPIKSILIVDDEEDIREPLREIFSHIGVKVTVASNGSEAILLLRSSSESYDVILSDMRMPIVDGPQFLKSVKDDFKYKGLFFFITGNINIDLESDLYEVDGYLNKPFKEDEIFSLIESKLKKS